MNFSNQVNIQYLAFVAGRLVTNSPMSFYQHINTFVRFESRVIPTAAALLHFVSGKLLAIYYKNVVIRLQGIQNYRQKPIKKLMNTFSLLDEAANQLEKSLGLLNFLNTCYIFINSFISAFYIIMFAIRGNIIDCILHTASCIENWVRLYLLCQMSEDIASSVSLND